LDVLHSELDKFTNQARFVKMIIDGKLVVSKKKKMVLVQELRKFNFKPFPKVADAKKAGETDPTVDEHSDEEAEAEAGASDYDYLLGMPIWSLTEERVAKLLKQIGDKELQIDQLIKVQPKQMWTDDLDVFINEWHVQLSDEKKRRKKNEASGRRGSSKLGLAGKGPKRKRKDDESDDDFLVAKKKPAVKTQSALSRHFPPADTKPNIAETASKAGAAIDDDFMDIDNIGYSQKSSQEPVLAVKQQAKSTAAAKAKLIKKEPAAKVEKLDLSDVDDVFAAVEKQAASRKVSDAPARHARTAATKAKTYIVTSSDEDDSFASNGDDMLGDVSMMVKGIGTSSGEKTMNGTRPLFSKTIGRPSSAHGLPRSISKPRLTIDHQLDDSDGIDETDYKSLIPTGSPLRPAARRAGETKLLDDDEAEDSFDVPVPVKPKALAKKKVAPAVKKVAAKPAPAPKVEIKKPIITLSPGAKAYALKMQRLKDAVASQATAGADKKKKPAPAPAKKKKPAFDSDDEDLANDILSDEPVVARPSRRAAAAKPSKSKYAFSDDEDEDEDHVDEDEDSFMEIDSD
jgi:DNA topoisomerase II